MQDHPARAAAQEANQAAGSAFAADPFRAPHRWAGERGTYELTTFTDREGTERSAALHGPPDGTQGPHPGVLLLCHACGSDIPISPPYHTVEDLPAWYWAAEVLAEAGYVVMTAELFGNEATRAVDATDFLTATPEDPSPQGEFNPWHDRLDRDRLGITGHSGASLVATDVGNSDERFDAVVGWDPAPVGGLDEVTPRAPTMFQVPSCGASTRARQRVQFVHPGVTSPVS